MMTVENIHLATLKKFNDLLMIISHTSEMINEICTKYMELIICMEQQSRKTVAIRGTTYSYVNLCKYHTHLKSLRDSASTNMATLVTLISDYRIAMTPIIIQIYSGAQLAADDNLYEACHIRINVKLRLEQLMTTIIKIEEELEHAINVNIGNMFNISSNKNMLLLPGQTDFLPVSTGYLDEADNNIMCECGAIMIAAEDTDMIKCSDCGTMRYTITDDVKYTTDDRAKSTPLPELKHFHKWWSRILGGGIHECDLSMLAKMRHVIDRDAYKPHQITSETIRIILSDPYVKGSKYNAITTALIVHFGGEIPPTFTDHDRKVIAAKFIKVIQLHNEVTINDPHRPYYPFYIWQIVRHLYKADAEKLRILDYIHLQSDDTIARNGATYRDICHRLSTTDDIVYYACDSSLKYI